MSASSTATRGGTAAIDLAEATGDRRDLGPGQTRLANLGGQVGHVHATTPMMSAVSALETIATGWRPGDRRRARGPARDRRLPGPTAPATAAGPALVTAANWGGTYASLVLGPVAWTVPAAPGRSYEHPAVIGAAVRDWATVPVRGRARDTPGARLLADEHIAARIAAGRRCWIVLG